MADGEDCLVIAPEPGKSPTLEPPSYAPGPTLERSDESRVVFACFTATVSTADTTEHMINVSAM
eukprot:1631607-Prymnesium_polylepis.2